MKNIKIYNKFNLLISNNNFCENHELEERLKYMNSSNFWGKPKRWILQNSEYYEENDILQTEVRIRKYTVNELNELGHIIEVQKEEMQTWVLLQADYVIEIIDLDKDYDWLLSECHRKRQSEYPQITELADALYWKEQGDNFKYVDYINKCDAIKKKYPLPLKQNDETQENTE